MTTNQLINSEVIGEKDESLSPPEKFQFVLTGELLTENNSDFFRLENGVKFKVRRVIASSKPSGMANWQVVPTTDNDGQIVNLILDSCLSESALRTTPSSLLIEAGRIVEVAKKGDRIKVKVKRGGKQGFKNHPSRRQKGDENRSTLVHTCSYVRRLFTYSTGQISSRLNYRHANLKLPTFAIKVGK